MRRVGDAFLARETVGEETASVIDAHDVRSIFLAGASTIAEAITDPAVASAWDQPSVLEDQLVSGLVGHLARGGVWVVAEYLDAGEPEAAVDVRGAGEYFATFAATAGADDHRAIRDRGAAVASVGRRALLERVTTHLGALRSDLEALPPDHLISVMGGTVMRLDEYLITRIVEQGVHLDDLARSVGREPWSLPEGHSAITISIGIEVARRRHGSSSVVRSLYRRGFAETTFPVL
jgi:hypothetical protein